MSLEGRGAVHFPRRWIFYLIVVCTLLNGAGFLWDIFEPVPLYDEIAQVITSFTLVAITAEIIYRYGVTTSSSTRPATLSSREA